MNRLTMVDALAHSFFILDLDGNAGAAVHCCMAYGVSNSIVLTLEMAMHLIDEKWEFEKYIQIGSHKL